MLSPQGYPDLGKPDTGHKSHALDIGRYVGHTVGEVILVEPRPVACSVRAALPAIVDLDDPGTVVLEIMTDPLLI